MKKLLVVLLLLVCSPVYAADPDGLSGGGLRSGDPDIGGETQGMGCLWDEQAGGRSSIFRALCALETWWDWL